MILPRTINLRINHAAMANVPGFDYTNNRACVIAQAFPDLEARIDKGYWFNVVPGIVSMGDLTYSYSIGKWEDRLRHAHSKPATFRPFIIRLTRVGN